MRRAVIDRRTTETPIALTLGLDGTGRYRVRTGIRFLDHMLELVARHGAFDLTHRRDAATSTSISTTPSRISASRSARRCRPRSATGAASTAPATSSCRWTRRWRSRPSTSAAGRTPSSTCRCKVRARRRSADRAGPRLLRGLRDRRARQRAREGAVRPIEPPPDRGGLQGVRAARCASRARRTRGWRACCPAPKGCCDRAHRLRRRQPDVGAQGARRDRRRRLRAGARRRDLGDGRAASSCPASATSAPRARSTARGATPSSRASARDGRCSASASACSGCSRAARKRRTAPGLGLLAGPLLSSRRRAVRRGGATAQGAPRRLEHARRSPRRASIVDGRRRTASQVYFTHSYAAPVTGDTVAVTEHGEPFAAVVERGHVSRRAVPPREVGRRRTAASCATSSRLAG